MAAGKKRSKQQKTTFTFFKQAARPFIVRLAFKAGCFWSAYYKLAADNFFNQFFQFYLLRAKIFCNWFKRFVSVKIQVYRTKKNTVRFFHNLKVDVQFVA